MNISVIGGGYVGLVMAAGLAEIGHSVVCAEHDPEKLALLNGGISPIHETGLTELLSECLHQKTLTFVSSIAEAIKNVQLIFIAVGTPSASDGSADTSAVTSVALEIGKYLASKCVIAIKSTVPVGTCAHVEKLINQEALSSDEINQVTSYISDQGWTVDDLKAFLNSIGLSTTQVEEIANKLS